MNVYLKLLNRVSFFSNFINKPIIEEDKAKKIDNFLDFIGKKRDPEIVENKDAIDLNLIISNLEKTSKDKISSGDENGIIIKNKPSEIVKYKIDLTKDYTITKENEYFRTQTNPPTVDEFFRYGLHKFSLSMKDDFPESAYMDDSGNFIPRLPNGVPSSTLNYRLKYHNHWGQRKLLCTEIDFLNYCLENKNEKIDIIYAGAAHGIHLPFLFHLFPNIKLHLYDPAVFSDKLKPFVEKGQIIINEFYMKSNIDKNTPFVQDKKGVPENYGYFTDEVAAFLNDKYFNPVSNHSNCLFISDVRRDVRKEPNESYNDYTNRFEKLVFEDQENQQKWIRIIRPKFSMIKFKLPYVAEGREQYYKHMKGIIRFQIWHPSNSAETRLVIKHKDIDTDVYYNTISYERKNAYYNYLRQNALNNKLIKIFRDNKLILNIPLKSICYKVTNKILYNTIDFYNEIYLLYSYFNKFILNDMPYLREDKLSNAIIENMRLITATLDKRGNADNFILKRKDGDFD